MADECKYMDTDAPHNPDDDILLDTYPIFLSNELTPHLHLVQYNNKSADTIYIQQPQNIQYKPIQHILSMQYPFNNTLERADTFIEDDTNDSVQYDIPGITLHSTTVPCKANYAIGVIRDKQVHLTSLNHILRMQPDFSHVDTAAVQQSKQRRGSMQSDASLDEQHSTADDTADEKEAELQPILTKYKRRENERTIALKKLSYQYIQGLEQSEAGTELQYLDSSNDNEQYSDVVERLICESADSLPAHVHTEQACECCLCINIMTGAC